VPIPNPAGELARLDPTLSHIIGCIYNKQGLFTVSWHMAHDVIFFYTLAIKSSANPTLIRLCGASRGIF